MQMFSDKNKQAGLSFVEFLVSIMLIGVIVGALFNILQSGLNTWRFGDVKMDLMSSTRRGIEKMAREIREGGRDSIIVTYIDQYRDSIEFYADIDYGVGEPGDLEIIKYELLDTGEIQKMITDSDGSIYTFILVPNIVELHFIFEGEAVVAIRLKGQKDDLVSDVATKVWPRNV